MKGKITGNKFAEVFCVRIRWLLQQGRRKILMIKTLKIASEHICLYGEEGEKELIPIAIAEKGCMVVCVSEGLRVSQTSSTFVYIWAFPYKAIALVCKIDFSAIVQ